MERILPEFDLVLEEGRRRCSAGEFCDRLRQFLRRGSRSFPEGGALAPERQVAARYGIGRGTVHKAYEQLAAEGLLRRRENGRCYLVCSAGEEGFPCIGIILPRRFEEYYAPESLSGPMSQGYYNGFAGEAGRRGFATVPLFPPAPEAPRDEVQRWIDTVLPRLVGLLHLGDRGFETDPTLELIFLQQKIPQILLCGAVDYPNVTTVSFDCDLLAETLLQYLQPLGHRRLGLCLAADCREHHLCCYDLTGSPQAMALFARHGVEILEEACLYFSQPADLERQLLKLLEQEQCPTAFWCRNDIFARELTAAIRRIGCRVPEDFSVIGFRGQNTPDPGAAELTSLLCSREEIGRLAAETLIRKIQVPTLVVPRRLGVPVRLCVRDTSGPAAERRNRSQELDMFL